MKIQTFSILAGSESCNARCGFCISKMTYTGGLITKKPDINWRNFDIAAQFAKQHGATTAMLTGKGEPTLFPTQITEFLEHLQPHGFPFKELQTNGIMIAERPEFDAYLKQWYDLGLTTIAVSIVHVDPALNRQVYTPYRKEYIDLPALINKLHTVGGQYGFSVRLTVTMARGYVDSPDDLEKLLGFAQANKVEQLTVRPVNKPLPGKSRDPEVYKWTGEHQLTPGQIESITGYVASNGTKLIELVHGAQIFDVRGQNLCLTDCLSMPKQGEDNEPEVRQAIFFPDGHLRYDWQNQGAILL